MAGQRSSFGKLQRDRDKKAKAAAKRVRRQEGGDEREPLDGAEDTAAAPDAGRQLPTAELLERIAEIHQQFDAGVISYEQFEETKSDLLSRLPVD
jgi:hypothetical protein